MIFLIRRPMTLGVRAIVFDRERNAVLFVRHTYVSGWHLPGGGVEAGEPMVVSLERELAEEANISLDGAPQLRSLHYNRQSSRRDHVALYLVEAYRQSVPKQPDREIAEARFFDLDDLPDDVTSATRRRLCETFEGRDPDPFW